METEWWFTFPFGVVTGIVVSLVVVLLSKLQDRLDRY